MGLPSLPSDTLWVLCWSVVPLTASSAKRGGILTMVVTLFIVQNVYKERDQLEGISARYLLDIPF